MNFKFNENGRKFPKLLENTVGKGEIELGTGINQGLFGKGLRYIAVGNIARKGEIACNKQFLLFSQCFLPFMVLIFHFKCTIKCRLQMLSIWTSLKFCRLVMGLSDMEDIKEANTCTNGWHSNAFILILDTCHQYIVHSLVHVIHTTDFVPVKRNKLIPLREDKILDWSKLKQIADDMLK